MSSPGLKLSLFLLYTGCGFSDFPQCREPGGRPELRKIRRLCELSSGIYIHGSGEDVAHCKAKPPRQLLRRHLAYI